MQFEGMAYLRAMLGKEQDLAQIIAKIDVLPLSLRSVEPRSTAIKCPPSRTLEQPCRAKCHILSNVTVVQRQSLPVPLYRESS
jgi:hypothetical protein